MIWVKSPLRKCGTRFKNAQGDWATMIEDIDHKNVKILFDSGTTTTVAFSHLKDGEFKDWMKPTVCGFGYMGAPRGKVCNVSYKRWAAMIQRCYSDKSSDKSKLKSYRGVVVCDDWLNFSSFAKWYKSQRNYDKTDWHIDKDLLSGGKGKVYSPETCVLLPLEINLNIKQRRVNQTKYGRGVVKYGCKYVARMARDGYKSDRLNEVLGTFSTPQEAALCYKTHKESFVKELAERWKDELDTAAYSALLAWEVENTEEELFC